MSKPVCIVTGASRGIGREIALRFARDGYAIVAVARGQSGLDALRSEIEADGGDCESFSGSAGEPGVADAVGGRALERFGRVDVLVNNAGAAPLAPIDAFADDDFAAAIDANVASVFRMTRAVWKPMCAAGGGVIVSISSVSSVDPFPGFAVYGACKAWVNLFTQAVAQEGRPHGIRVYGVAPGAVETQMLRSAFPDFPADQTLAPGAVADAVAEVCRPGWRFSTGQTIFVRR